MSTLSNTITPTENSFKTLIKRNQLLFLYLLMFLLAYPGLIWEAAYSQGYISTQSPIWLSVLTGWGPGIAAVTVTAISFGREGVRKLLGRFLILRVGFGWYLVGLFLLAVFILGGIGLHVLFAGKMPPIPAAGSPLWSIVLSFVLLVVVGLLLNTEEIAWRGFVLPHLQAKYGPLLAGILLAIPESLLHLPYFFNKDVDFYQTVGMFWFTAFSVAAVFIYTFVFNKTNGSLVIVTLLHTSQNAWVNLLSDNSLRPFQFTVALMWMTAIALIFATNGRLGYEDPSK